MRRYIRKTIDNPLAEICFGLCISAFINILGVVPAFSADAEPPKPKIKLAEPAYDFGSVSQGTRVKHDFVVKNEGNADLVIQQLIPACGCTAASVNGGPIPPGKEGSVHVEFDTTGFSGEKVKTVRLTSNDAAAAESILTIRGIVEPDVFIEPKAVFFGDVVKGAQPAPVQTVTVRAREGSGVRVKGLSLASIGKASGGATPIIIKELESSPTAKKFTVAVNPEAPIGNIRTRVVVETSGGMSTSINVPVVAFVKGHLKLSPPDVSFGVIEGTEAIAKNVKLENLGGEAVKIKEIKSSDPAITSTFKAIQGGKVYVIEVKVDPKLVTTNVQTSLQIVTDSKEESILSIGVRGTLPPKV